MACVAFCYIEHRIARPDFLYKLCTALYKLCTVKTPCFACSFGSVYSL